MPKPFKTLDEQIDILISRGVSVSDRDRSKDFLLTNTYYNVINCYSKYFIKSGDIYISDTEFTHFSSVSFFDKEIKQVMFKYLIQAEKHLKSILSYYYSEQYQEVFPYMNCCNYNILTPDDLLNATNMIGIFTNVITKHRKKNDKNSIQHYYKKHDEIPTWVIINYLTFGQTNYFYSSVIPSIQNKVAKRFSDMLSCCIQSIQGVSLAKSPIISIPDLQNILSNLGEVRNLIAHNNKLLGFRCKNHYPYIMELHNYYHIKSDSKRQNIYSTLLIMQLFLSPTEYGTLHNTIRKRFIVLHKNIPVQAYEKICNSLGFPVDFHNVSTIPQ